MKKKKRIFNNLYENPKMVFFILHNIRFYLSLYSFSNITLLRNVNNLNFIILKTTKLGRWLCNVTSLSVRSMHINLKLNRYSENIRSYALPKMSISYLNTITCFSTNIICKIFHL